MDDVAGRPIFDEPREPVLRVTLDLHEDGRVAYRTDFPSLTNEMIDELAGARASADLAALQLLARGIQTILARWVG